MPKPDYGNQNHDRSKYTLGFVTQILNAAVSKQAVPQVNTLNVTSLQ